MNRLKGMGRLPKMKVSLSLKGGKAFDEEDDSESLEAIVDLPSPFAEEEDDGVLLIHRRIGGRSEDLGLAKRLWGWLQTELSGSVIPEAIVYDYLKLSGRPFIYQSSVFGGRTTRGGLVPDFLVEQDGEWMVWNVQGEYWHSESVNQGKDSSFRFRLMGAIILGMKIGSVVELWESDLYNQRPKIWSLAWAGRGLRE